MGAHDECAGLSDKMGADRSGGGNSLHGEKGELFQCKVGGVWRSSKTSPVTNDVFGQCAALPISGKTLSRRSAHLLQLHEPNDDIAPNNLLLVPAYSQTSANETSPRYPLPDICALFLVQEFHISVIDRSGIDLYEELRIADLCRRPDVRREIESTRHVAEMLWRVAVRKRAENNSSHGGMRHT